MFELLRRKKQGILSEATAVEKELVQIIDRKAYLENRIEQLKGAYKVVEELEVELDTGEASPPPINFEELIKCVPQPEPEPMPEPENDPQ